MPVPQPMRCSYAKHRRDVNRQVILPVAFVTVMVGVLAALILFMGDVDKWSAIAIIWMVIPLTLLLLVALAVAWGAVYLMGRLLKVSPHYTGIAQAYALWFNAQVLLWTDKIILPLIQIQAWLSLFSKQENKTEETPHVQEKQDRRKK
ncbi:MAG: hypothetical protein WA821_18155 [Anaerolineales bacterium]